jgi:hypothetical protein
MNRIEEVLVTKRFGQEAAERIPERRIIVDDDDS